MMKTNQLVFALTFTLAMQDLAASTLPGGWEIKFDDGTTCNTQVINFVDGGFDEPGMAGYQQNPEAYSPRVRVIKDGFFAGASYYPFADVKEFRFKGISTVDRSRTHRLTLKSGLQGNFDDAGGINLVACPANDTATGKSCVNLAYMQISCMNVNEGVTTSRYVQWHSTGPRSSPPANATVAKILELRALEPQEIEDLTTRFENAKASRSTRLAAQKAAADKLQRTYESSRKEALEKENASRLRTIRDSPAGTAMFCESNSEFLLQPGQPITRANYTCDLLGPRSIGLREILSNGWSVVTENRTVLPTMGGGQGLVVSLQLRKNK